MPTAIFWFFRAFYTTPGIRILEFRIFIYFRIKYKHIYDHIHKNINYNNNNILKGHRTINLCVYNMFVDSGIRSKVNIRLIKDHLPTIEICIMG